jgi:hypothetical protein
MANENSGETHGYRWPDGSMHDKPFQQEEGRMYRPVVIQSRKQGKTLHVTQEQYDKAYAAWVKAFTDWQQQYDAWKTKHGKV